MVLKTDIWPCFESTHHSWPGGVLDFPPTSGGICTCHWFVGPSPQDSSSACSGQCKTPSISEGFSYSSASRRLISFAQSSQGNSMRVSEATGSVKGVDASFLARASASSFFCTLAWPSTHCRVAQLFPSKF